LCTMHPFWLPPAFKHDILPGPFSISDMHAMAEFLPLARMWARAEQDKEDSDYAYATSLLYMGEMQAKLITAGMLAAIKDDKDKASIRPSLCTGSRRRNWGLGQLTR
jgi:hypothetical protein